MVLELFLDRLPILWDSRERQTRLQQCERRISATLKYLENLASNSDQRGGTGLTDV